MLELINELSPKIGFLFALIGVISFIYILIKKPENKLVLGSLMIVFLCGSVGMLSVFNFLIKA